MQPAQDTLHRGLEERHINLMALGATIGVGLFLGSATAIKMAGPPSCWPMRWAVSPSS